MSSLHPDDRLGSVTDELTAAIELPTGARAALLEAPTTVSPESTTDRLRRAYGTAKYEVRHPENHKQLVRFLCVGASGYVVNLATFYICIHLLHFADVPSLAIAFLIGSTNNFWWNRHWTFGATEDHPVGQAMRFFAVSTLVFFFATGIYVLIVQGFGFHSKVTADGIAWIIATPISFLVQKLWSFKA
jgi:putative flippase GtrA